MEVFLTHRFTRISPTQVHAYISPGSFSDISKSVLTTPTDPKLVTNTQIIVFECHTLLSLLYLMYPHKFMPSTVPFEQLFNIQSSTVNKAGEASSEGPVYSETFTCYSPQILIQLIKVPALDPHQNVDQIQQTDRLKPFLNSILQQTFKIRRTCNATSSSIIHHQFYLHVLHYKLKPSNHQDFISTY